MISNGMIDLKKLKLKLVFYFLSEEQKTYLLYLLKEDHFNTIWNKLRSESITKEELLINQLLYKTLKDDRTK